MLEDTDRHWQGHIPLWILRVKLLARQCSIAWNTPWCRCGVLRRDSKTPSPTGVGLFCGKAHGDDGARELMDLVIVLHGWEKYNQGLNWCMQWWQEPDHTETPVVSIHCWFPCFGSVLITSPLLDPGRCIRGLFGSTMYWTYKNLGINNESTNWLKSGTLSVCIAFIHFGE